jgi:hypothetical protein
MTRWGTQYQLCKSILNNREALEEWASRTDTQIGKENLQKKDILNDFWSKLQRLCQAITPIHKAQKMSEALGATLGKVIPRWNQLKNDLEALYPIIPQLRPFMESQFKERQKLQTRPIYIVALFLLPENRDHTMTSKLDNAVMSFL